jgi:hypothetical protein
MREKTWLTEKDIYTLNTMVVYAIEKFGIDFKINSFIATFKEQQRLMNRYPRK